MTGAIQEAAETTADASKKTRQIRRPKGMLFPVEAGEIVGQSEPTLRAWRAEGRENQPAYYKIGGHVWYKEKDCLDWMEQQRHSPGGETDDDGDDE